jgi:hypothetical protein
MPVDARPLPQPKKGAPGLGEKVAVLKARSQTVEIKLFRDIFLDHRDGNYAEETLRQEFQCKLSAPNLWEDPSWFKIDLKKCTMLGSSETAWDGIKRAKVKRLFVEDFVHG